MPEAFSDTVGDLVILIKKITGLYQQPSWEVMQQTIRSNSGVPKWASDTALSILGNMNQDDCNKYYHHVERRLRDWAKISNNSWGILEGKLNILFLNMTERNLIEISSPNQRNLSWIRNVISAKSVAMSFLENGELDRAKKEANLLIKFDASHAKLMNIDLAESTERLASAVVAATKLKGGVPEVAANAISGKLFDFRNHPLWWFISILDNRISH
jgi:hypothetical protein